MKKKMIIITISLIVIIGTIIIMLPISLPTIPPTDEPYLSLYKETGNSSSIRVISERMPLSEQLSTLYELGFAPKEEMKDLYETRLTENGWPEEVIEDYPYWLVFTALGWEYETEDGQLIPYSDATYCFSTWDNLTPDSYINILSQIKRISNGEIPLENIQSGRTKIFNRLWVSYELKNNLCKFSIPDDYFRNPHQIYNPGIIDNIAKYSASDDYEKNLYWMHDEQGFHLAYTTQQVLTNLRDVTGIDFFGLDTNQVPLN